MPHHGSSLGEPESNGFWKSKPGYKPVLLLIAFSLFGLVVITPPPRSTVALVGKENPSGYQLPSGTQSIADAVNRKLRPETYKKRAAKDGIGILVVAVGVASLGPIMIPMAELAKVHAWKVGLACAFSSSFANALIVGTPNNAITYGMGRDPETGQRLLEVYNFVKYGVPITILAWSSGSGRSSATGGSYPGPNQRSTKPFWRRCRRPDRSAV
jgi:hypothetical protein